VGALGGILYLRLLGRSVDGLGGGGGGSGAPRLLIPVILVLVFNRWAGADSFGRRVFDTAAGGGL
jgi:ATP synthase protein I